MGQKQSFCNSELSLLSTLFYNRTVETMISPKTDNFQPYLEWIKKSKTECPTCKTKAKAKDIRKIYPATLPLAVADNSEIIQLRKSKDELSKKVTVQDETITKQTKKIENLEKELKRRMNEILHLRNNRQSMSQVVDVTLMDDSNISVDFEFMG